MTTREIQPVFLPNQGQVLNAPEEFLDQMMSPYSRNMEYFNDLVQTRRGLVKLDDDVLSGPVLEQFRFLKSNQDAFNVMFTTKDIYKYDFNNGRYDILTPIYNTATVAVSGTAVTGTGTAFLANVKIGDYFKVGSGSIHTGATWYEITAVSSNTSLTLASSAGTVGAGSAYVIRQIFTGGATNFWSVTKFTDQILGDIMVATNGIDTPIYWTGSDQVVFITGLPDDMKARYVETYKERIIFAWTIEGGNNQPERVRAGEVANVNLYDELLFEDLIDDSAGITGMKKFGDYLIVTKNKVFYLGRFISGDNVFDYERVSGAVGSQSNRSLVADKQWLYYYGYDKKFHRWNLVSDEVISEEIFPETKNFDPNLEFYIKGENFYHRNQIRWFCPYATQDYNNYIFVYDYMTETGRVWNCSASQALLSISHYILQTDLYTDDPVWGEYYLDEQDGFWDDISYLSGAPVFIYGGYDGIVRECDNGKLDDGTEYTRILRFKRLNFQQPHLRKRLWKQQWWFMKEVGASVSLSFRLDDRTDAHPSSKTMLLDDENKDIVKRMVTIDLEAEVFQPELQSTDFFALVGFLNYIMHRKRNNG